MSDNTAFWSAILSGAAVFWWLLFYRRWQSHRLKSGEYLSKKYFLFALIADFCLSITISSLALFLYFSSKEPPIERGNFPESSEADFFILLDLSPSMALGDVKPSRWHRAILAIDEWTKGLGNSRAALIAFGDRAGVQSPLTGDLSALREIAWHSPPGLYGNSSRGVVRALNLAFEMIRRKPPPRAQNFIIVISDGVRVPSLPSILGNNLGDIEIAVVAVGSTTFTGGDFSPTAPFPPFPDGKTIKLKLSPKPVDISALKVLARALNGRFYTLQQLDGIGEFLSMSGKKNFKKTVISGEKKRNIFLSVALLALFLHWFFFRK